MELMLSLLSVLVNINDVLLSTDVFAEELVVRIFDMRVYPGIIQGDCQLAQLDQKRPLITSIGLPLNVATSTYQVSHYLLQ